MQENLRFISRIQFVQYAEWNFSLRDVIQYLSGIPDSISTLNPSPWICKKLLTEKNTTEGLCLFFVAEIYVSCNWLG